VEGYPSWHDGAVLDSAGLPPYPPQRNTWQYPPPPVDRRWFWLALAASCLGLLVGVAALTTAVVVGSRDFPALIQDERVMRVIEDECDLMTDTVRSLPVRGTVHEQVTALNDQNRAVRIMLADIRRRVDVGSDRPTEAWLRDWERLLRAREAYAAAVVDGRTTALRVPRDEDGERITRRMDDVWAQGTACEVPDVLLSPYPVDRSEV
jgi:hypothetical protein